MRLVFILLAALLTTIAQAQPVLRLKVPAQPGTRRASSMIPVRSHYIVQFAEAPTADVVAAIRAQGAEVIGDVPDNALMVVAGAPLDWTALGAVSAETLQPQQKISPLIQAAKEAPGRKAGVTPVYVVEFHADVDINQARGIVLGLGFELREHPELGPHRLMIAPAGRPLDALVERDEVAYIFPASGALATGLPVERCDNFTENGVVAQLITTYGSGWDGPGKNPTTLKYFYSSETTDLSSAVQRAEILRAMNAWSSVIALTWSAGSSATATRTVNIAFGSGSHGDSWPFDGPNGVLAHTFYPTSSEPIAGDLHLDDAETWNVGSRHDLFSVALHELGHALGLGHSDDPNAVMYAYYKQVTDLGTDDKNAALSIYAAATQAPEPPSPPPPPPTPAPLTPNAVSVAPSSGSGSSQTFSFVFSEATSQMNLTGLAVLFNTTSSIAVNGCQFVYDRTTNTEALLWDGANGSNRRAFGSATPLQNSFCSIGQVTIFASSTSITLNIPVTFKGPFLGAKNVYLYAAAGPVNTGWVQRGVYTVTGVSGYPVAQSVTPNSGSGTAETFALTIADAGGSGSLTGAAFLISNSLNAVNACYLVYDRGRNSISLLYDNALGASLLPLGSAMNIGNSQCTLHGAGTNVSVGATSITITVQLSFKSTFAGVKTLYLLAAGSNTNSGWQTKGTWAVASAGATVSMTPNSGMGNWPSFNISLSDGAGTATLGGMEVLFATGTAASPDLANACYIVYDRNAKTIGLYNDNFTSLGTKPLGSSATLQNARCAVGYAAGWSAGDALTLNLNLLLKSQTFSGTKTVFVRPLGGSTWTAAGAWIVP